MDRRLMQITVLAIVGVGAAAASQVPSPSGLLFMRVGRDRCHWVRAMPRLGMGRMGPKSLSCTVASGIHVVMDSGGIGSGGPTASAASDSGGVGSGGPQNMGCVWVTATLADTTAIRYLDCHLAVKLIVDTTGVGSGGT